MDALQNYYSHTQQIFDRILETQRSNIDKAADLVADVVGRDGIVYAFGSGHSFLPAMEFYGRAGGLACFDVIHDKTYGKAERLEGYASVLLDGYPLTSRDALIIISNSGRNSVPVEMALEAQKKGLRSVAITALEHSRQVASRHSSGKRLFEICEIVIDTCCPFGDTTVELDGLPGSRVGGTSTLAGVFIANCIVIQAVSKCVETQIDPPVFISANVDEGTERNRRLYDFVRLRTKGL